MTALELEQAALTVLARHFPRHPGPITPATRLREDLGADSLDLVELLYALEQALDVEIPETAAADLATVGDALRYLGTAGR